MSESSERNRAIGRLLKPAALFVTIGISSADKSAHAFAELQKMYLRKVQVKRS